MDLFDTNHVEVNTAEKQQRQEAARRNLAMRRRRALLWTPLALAGVALLVWQVTSNVPIPALVFVGIFAVLPWIVDC